MRLAISGTPEDAAVATVLMSRNLSTPPNARMFVGSVRPRDLETCKGSGFVASYRMQIARPQNYCGP
jgi:hypothetical protein